MKVVVRPFMPSHPPDGPTPPPLWQPGVLEQIATEAGPTPGLAFHFSFAYKFPDPETLGRLLLAPAGLATLIGSEREEAVRAQIVDALAPYRTAQGGYAEQRVPLPGGDRALSAPGHRRGSRRPRRR